MLSFFTTQSYVRLSGELKTAKAWESEILLVASFCFSDCTLDLQVIK